MYEYKVTDTDEVKKVFGKPETLESFLNEIASQGWRLWPGAPTGRHSLIWEREKKQ